MRRRTNNGSCRGGAAVAQEGDTWLAWLGMDGPDGRWQAVMIASLVAIAVSCAMLATRPTVCTTQEGLCTTTACGCVDPAHQLRELRTPEGQECWQCVALCPADGGTLDNSSSTECHKGHCECADQTQERIQMPDSTPDTPCWRCQTPLPVVSLSADSSSCLVRAPRSKLPPLPAPAGAAGSPAEPVLRLVLDSADSTDPNVSCASFIRDGAQLRERNTRLCLSWSVSGSLWGLGKCVNQGQQEAQLQSFEWLEGDYREGSSNSSSFCTETSVAIDSLQDVDSPAQPAENSVVDTSVCISLRGHVCTTEAGVCTPRNCECEEAGWIKHDIPLGEGNQTCSMCAPPVVAFCSTAAGVCTTAACECENPSHEKVASTTTEVPHRECWSCRPKTSSFGAAVTSSTGAAVGALVGVFLCGLAGGLLIRRWGGGPVPAFTVPKGKRGSKGMSTTSLRALPWSERVAQELEDQWASLKDGFGYLTHFWTAAAKPTRRWRRAAAGAAAPHIKTFSTQVQAVATHVTDAASACSEAISGAASSVRSVVSPTRSATLQPSSDNTVQRPRKANQPSQQGTKDDKISKAEPEVTAAPPSESFEFVEEDLAKSGSGVAPSGSCVAKTGDDTNRKKRRAKKVRSADTINNSVDATPTALAPGDEPDTEVCEGQDGDMTDEPAGEMSEPAAVHAKHEEVFACQNETLDQLDEARDLSAIWDPMDMSVTQSRDVQFARLIMLMKQGQGPELRVNKHTLAAKWLLCYHIRVPERSPPASERTVAAQPAMKVDTDVSAGETSTCKELQDGGSAKKRNQKRKEKRGVIAARHADVEHEADAHLCHKLAEPSDEVRIDNGQGWDPCCFEQSEAAPDDIQHARLLLLLSGSLKWGHSISKRALASTWLLLFYMPESCRSLPKPAVCSQAKDQMSQSQENCDEDANGSTDGSRGAVEPHIGDHDTDELEPAVIKVHQKQEDGISKAPRPNQRQRQRQRQQRQQQQQQQQQQQEPAQVRAQEQEPEHDFSKPISVKELAKKLERKESFSTDGNSSLLPSLPTTPMRVCNTFIEEDDGAAVPLSSRLKKSVSSGDVPLMCGN